MPPLPPDPGSGSWTPPKDAPREYPPPLDLTEQMENQPSFVRFGPIFEWQIVGGSWKLLVAFKLPTQNIIWRALSDEEYAQLRGWLKLSEDPL